MSRYRRTDDDLAYGNLPPTERWDAGRFNRESQQYRQAPVIEQRPPYESARRREPREPAYYEDDRYFREQYESGPRGTRDRQFFEEDEYYDPRATQGAMVPFRPARPARPAAPPRPTMIRRQSSVDRFDFERRRERQYERDDYRPPPPRPREGRNSRYEINIYDDVKVQDPEYYGDDGFREYREREWTRTRSRNDSPSPDRRAPTEIIDARPPERVEETIVQKEMIVEKPYPRKGKTRMPKRLVHTKVLFDLGYPFYEEDEKTILIEKALGPDNIDEVFARSKEIRERETMTTRLVEAPPPSAPPQTIYEAPRSVREWDNMGALERSPSPGSSISQSTRKTKSTRRARSVVSSRRPKSLHESIHEDMHRDRGSVHESFHKDVRRDISRSPSPARTMRSRKSRARSRAASRSRRSRSRSFSDDTTIIERKIIRRSDDVEESGTVDLNFPLAIAKVENRSRTDADIQDEIRRLERERRDIRRERDTEVVRYEPVRRSRVELSPVGRLREPSPRGEVIIENGRDEVVAVRKDKRDRARSKSRPPGPGLLKGLMYTVT